MFRAFVYSPLFLIAVTTLGFVKPASAQVQWSGNKHYYLAVSTPNPITWNQANALAQATGGYLATLTSAQENAFVFSLVDDPKYWGSDGNSLGPYFGGIQPPNSPEPGGGWQWITGELWNYTNWASGEPTNGVGSPHGMTEDILQFFGPGNTRTAQWNDYPATRLGSRGYIVEFNTALRTISGAVTLENAVNAAQTVFFTFRPTSSEPSFTRTATLNADKTFSLTGIPGNAYTLHIKGDRWLAQNVSVDATNGDVSGVTATLKAGDANNDNMVDIADFGILVNAYNSKASIPGSGYDANADFNADGIVDIADFGILVNNYNASGAP